VNRCEAIELVRELERAVNAHDTGRIMRFYAEGAVSKGPMHSEVAGLPAIAESWDRLFSLMPDWAVKVQDVLVDGGRIAFTGGAEATDRGWFGQPATGERIGFRAFVVLTTHAGQIVRDERMYDLTGVLERLEKARIDRELQMAAEVQRVLLPRGPHTAPHCETAAESVACRAIGGDFFEIAAAPGGGLAVALGDVSGKGPAAALVAAMIQGMLASEGESGRGPAEVVRAVNSMLTRRTADARFATMVYGVRTPNGRFVYASAGHNPPILSTACGVRRLAAGGPPLGFFADAGFEEATVCLDEGETLTLFSDGVTEACDARGEEFGDERLIACTRDLKEGSAREALRRILEGVEAFCEGTPYSDDVTAVVVRRRSVLA